MIQSPRREKMSPFVAATRELRGRRDWKRNLENYSGNIRKDQTWHVLPLKYLNGRKRITLRDKRNGKFFCRLEKEGETVWLRDLYGNRFFLPVRGRGNKI